MQEAQSDGPWQELDGRIKRWRSQRETLIHQLEYGVISTQTPQYSTNHSTRRKHPRDRRRPPYSEIKKLCENMVDYLSTGHFDMYSQLLGAQDTKTNNKKESTVVEGIYQRIERSTDVALHFNDKYDADEASINTEPTLPKDITELSDELNQRFALEDKLIDILHNQLSTSAP